MEKMGRFAVFCHSVGITVSALLFFFSIGGFFGGGEMIAGAVIAMALYGVLFGLSLYALLMARRVADGAGAEQDKMLRWTRALLLTYGICAAAGGWVIGFLTLASCGPTFLAPLHHWGGLALSACAFFLYFVMPSRVREAIGTHAPASGEVGWRWPLGIGLGVFGLWAVVWMILGLVLMGDIDEDSYPDASSSAYRLPWPEGTSSWVIQGNRSSYNHDDHAWDFRLACGTDVRAARGGTVTKLVNNNDGHGGDSSNNLIEVTHSDSPATVARYLHIKKDSGLTVGSTVSQGDKIAEVGNVGNSLTGHIHFVVEQGGSSVPVSFQDVSQSEGIPRTFGIYWAGD